jgi:uncharacterized protein YidB (DUF937 family)
MAKFPSMLALLGLAAFAGYQNRDKIAGAIKDAQTRRDDPNAQKSGLDHTLAGLGDLFDGNREGGGLLGGLGELLDGFRSHGQAETADSWVTTGPNKGLTAAQVEDAVGADNIAELSKRTGLSRDELLERLATNLPDTVDRMTPKGKLPDTDDDLIKSFG